VPAAAAASLELTAEAAGGATGAAGGAAGVVCTDDDTLSLSSEVAFRNSRIALPAAEPSSGSRPGPKMMSTITRMATIHSG